MQHFVRTMHIRTEARNVVLSVSYTDMREANVMIRGMQHASAQPAAAKGKGGRLDVLLTPCAAHRSAQTSWRASQSGARFVAASIHVRYERRERLRAEQRAAAASTNGCLRSDHTSRQHASESQYIDMHANLIETQSKNKQLELVFSFMTRKIQTCLGN